MAPVEFNFRVLRADKKPITAREVWSVLKFFLDYRREPDGYIIEAINWRAPKAKMGKRAWRYPDSRAEGRETMLDHFWAILKVEGIEALRTGAVKRNKL